MEILKHICLSLVLLSCSTNTKNQIPAEFQGIWDNSEQTCAMRFSDKRLHIKASAIEYWESSGVLLEIIASKSISLTARFEMSGEGVTWTSLNTYFLTPEKDKLTQVFNDGTKVTRIRCNLADKPLNRALAT